jgi:hypothetical protein
MSSRSRGQTFFLHTSAKGFNVQKSAPLRFENSMGVFGAVVLALSIGAAQSSETQPHTAQTTAETCQAGEPPLNKFLADSPWPMMHRSSYAQASTCLRGPEPGDQIDVRYVDTPGNSASCWMYFSEKYPDGKRAIFGGNVSHAFKALSTSDGLRVVSADRVNWKWLNFANWGHIALRGNRHLAIGGADGRDLILFEDSANNVDAPMREMARTSLPPEAKGTSALFNVTYDGWIAFNTDQGYFGLLRNDFRESRVLQLPLDEGEVAWHNQFPLDENGNIYIVTTKRLMHLNWDGQNVRVVWTSPYDFIGNGPKGKMKGSGTTPTLLGMGNQDKLVVMVDGHTPSNLVAFWRGEPPADWRGLPGFDRRIASITPLPYASYNARMMGTEFQAIENSPVARDYDVAVAQYNGFAPACNPVAGVQKLRWDPARRTMNIVWANGKVSLNNVLVYSEGSGLLYGSGRKNCVNTFYALDWQTGEVKIEKPLGREDTFLDQGNGWQIGEDRNIIASTPRGFIEIRAP